MSDRAVRDALLQMRPMQPDRLVEIAAPGVYAWWGRLSYPAGFSAVDVALPLYVGIADRQTLGQRAKKNHLAATRRSSLRRTLAAVLADELELRAEVIPDPKGKFGFSSGTELRLTDWMLTHLQVTWVPLEEPGIDEEAIIRELLPVLKHEHATGSPYRAILARMRRELRAGGVNSDAQH